MMYLMEFPRGSRACGNVDNVRGSSGDIKHRFMASDKVTNVPGLTLHAMEAESTSSMGYDAQSVG